MVARTDVQSIHEVRIEGTLAEHRLLACVAQGARRLPHGATVTVTLARPPGRLVVHFSPCGCGCGGARIRTLPPTADGARPGWLRRIWAAFVRGGRWLVGATLPRPRSEADA